MNTLILNDGQGKSSSFLHKGDVFTRGISSLPPVYTVVTMCGTGRSYLRRARLGSARCITISDVLALVTRKKVPKESLADLVLYAGRRDSKLLFDDQPFEGREVSLRFVRTEQHIGFRYWFVCPRCSERRATVYASLVAGQDMWGCRSCLGLSYPSQHGHKTLWHDNRVVGRKGTGIRGWTPTEPANTMPTVKARAQQRLSRRTDRFCALLSRVLEKER